LKSSKKNRPLGQENYGKPSQSARFRENRLKKLKIIILSHLLIKI